MRKHFSTRSTHQTQPVPDRTDQVKNDAGGYVFAIDDWKRLQRFLILGTDGGTYYVDERKLTIDNAQAVKRCMDSDGPRTVNEIVEISLQGRAPSNNQALFALAMCAGTRDPRTRSLALNALPKVARTGTHLFMFAHYVEGFRGWGRGLKSAVSNWYNSKKLDKLLLQLVKYQSRTAEEKNPLSKWNHMDLLRLAHPNPTDPIRGAAYRWVTKRHKENFELPRELEYLAMFEDMQTAPNTARVIELIKKYNFPMETIPTQFKQKREVWEALLPNIGMTALIRNLGNLSKCGLLVDGDWDTIRFIRQQLTNQERLKDERIHPIQLLAASVVYGQGHGAKSDSTWPVSNDIVSALDEAFHLSFGYLVPTGKRTMLSVDVSGSMDWEENSLRRIPGLRARHGAAAMAMITYRSEEQVIINAFSTSLQQLRISKTDRLDRVMRAMQDVRMGGTDCSAPILHALKNGLKIDAFGVYTDNETWAGQIHPFQALESYRQKTGIDAKLITVGMTSSGFSIADPRDPDGMLDVVGFDTATPSMMNRWITGEI